MRWLRLSLLALALFVPFVLADEPPREEPAPKDQERPLVEPEAPALPARIRISIEHPGGHIGQNKQLLFTPNGKDLITTGTDNTIRVRDVHTGETLRILRVPGGLGTIDLSPDGRTLAVVYSHKQEETVSHVVALMSLADGHIERLLRGHTEGIRVAVFSPDGKHLASASNDKTLRIWDLTNSEAPAQVIKTDKVIYALAFSPDGNRLVEARDEAPAVLRDLSNDKVVVLKGTLAESFWGNTAVAWSRDGKSIATATKEGLRVWDHDGKLRYHVLKDSWAASVAFSGDGRRLLVTGWSTPSRAWILDAHTGKEERMLTEQSNPHQGIFSPDGNLAATIGDIDNISDVVLWRTSNGTVVRRMAAGSRLAGPGLQAGWGPSGHVVSWKKVEKGGDTRKGEPTSFDLSELTFGKHLEGNRFHGAIVQQGPLSLKHRNGSTVEVLRDGKHLTDLKLPSPSVYRMGLVRDPMVLVSKDRAALISSAKNLWIYDPHTGELLSKPYAGWPFSGAGSPDGRYLLTLSRDQILRIWNVETGKVLVSLFVFGHDWIAWTPRGYYAASPGGEKRVGWVVDNGIDQAPSFYPAERFRKVLYRPDVIKLLLDKGNLEDALAAANAARKQEGETVNQAPADVEQLVPPQVTLEVVDRTALPKVKVKATAVSRGQPVQALRLLVDGRPLPEGGGVLDLKAGQAKAEAEWEVELPPGDHEMKVLARSPDVAGVSPGVPVSVSAPAKERPTLHLIAVGVNAYQQKGLQLNCAVNDARSLAQAFQEHCAGQGNLFGTVQCTPLLDDKATHAGVLQALQEARKAVKPGDLLVFSFAGHGVKQGKEFYLLTVEADTTNLAQTALSGKELRQALADMPCQVLVLLDACHSAAGVEALRKASDDAARDLSDDDCGVTVLCAAMGQEKALEGDQHGYFTQALVEALVKQKDVPYNYRDGRQYVHHLFAYIFDEVKDLSHDEQHPFLNLPFVTESFPIRRLGEHSLGEP